MLIDSHCHLNFPEFEGKIENTLNQAWNLGVRGFLTINTRLNEAKTLQDIADAHKNIACTVGVHPHDAQDYCDTPLKEHIREFTQHPKVVGIWETGLDYYYEHSPKEPQQWSFRQHIEIARELDLPLVIHTRDADDDTIALLDEYKNATSGTETRGVFHCFSGTLDLCKKALDRGFYISISGIVTFKKAENVHEAAKYVPLDRLLVETDAPYLAPVPHRGKPNEPSFVVYTAERIAELRGISLSKISDATTENFFTLFNRTKTFFS